VEVPEVRYVRNGDIALAYQVIGTGPLDLVHVPTPWISNLEIAWENPLYARFLRKLASFSRLVLLDRRGTGLSDRLSPHDLPSAEVLMEDLTVVLDAVGSERTVLFGDSDSGCLCAIFAATHPERTAALITQGAAARGTASDDYPWQWSDERWDAYLSAVAMGWGTAEYAAETLAWLAPSLAGDAAQRRWWTRMQRLSASPSSMVAIERIWSQIDIRPILATIQVPTLVLHRTGDPVEDVRAGRDLARRIPGATFVELPGDQWPMFAGDQNAITREIETFVRGIREEEAELDRVLATVLMTDIVGSTERAAELGDRRWGELLEAHNSQVRALLSRYRGLETDTTGDGFVATFDGPARAVKCAAAIVDAVRSIGLEIRAGVHTGEIEVVDDDVRGLAVHIGARIAGMAGAGEVLVSSTVKDLVAGSGLVFEDRGAHSLKGVPDLWRVYGVAIAGARPPPGS
jgi:class 3 adenylate cyclase